MVVAIAGGALVDQFTGALPKAQVKDFIDRVLEAAGMAPPAEPQAPTDPVAAEAHWRAALAADAQDGQALLELGRALTAQGRLDEAGEAFRGIKARMDQYNAAQTALAAQELLTDVVAAGGEAAVRARLAAAPNDPEARYLVACADGVAGRHLESLRVLVALIAGAPPEIKDRAKKAASILFDTAGRDDEEIELLRRKLARLLF
jgi:putative thioredoxin